MRRITNKGGELMALPSWLSKLFLQFTDPRLESAFAQDYVGRFVPQVQIALVFATLVLLSDIAVDSFLYPAESVRANYVRAFVVLPCVVSALALSFVTALRKYLDLLFSTLILLGSAGLFWALHFLEMDGGLGLTSAAGGINYIFVVLLLFLVSGVRFRVALWTGATLTGIYLWFTYQTLYPNTPNFIALSYHTMSLFLLGVFLGYWREWFVRQVYKFNVELDHERSQTESMLHDLIPERIVSALRTRTPPIAEPIGEATVIFADIHGFTGLTKKLAPEHLLEVLDKLFGAFDATTDKNKIDKVKIIGDCYMAVSPSTAGREAALHAVECGIQWQKATREIGAELNIPLELRIGIHTGSIIGGVIGSRRWAYDYWGNTVIIASRIQTAADPSEMLLSETTYNRIRSMITELSHKEVELRGIGPMTCYSYRI